MYFLGILKERQCRAHYMKCALSGIGAIFLFSVFFTVSNCKGVDANFSSSMDPSTTLFWDVPTTNEDGSPLTDLAGYTVHYGTTQGSHPEHIDVGDVMAYSILSLPSGTYFFVVTASNTSGISSVDSCEVSKVVP